MRPRDRFLTAIGGGMPDQVPFAIWSNKLPRGELREQILARQVCVVVKASAYNVLFEGINIERRFLRDGTTRQRVRTVYHTPAGNLETLTEEKPGTTWILEHLFRDVEDYDALEAVLRARRHKPCHDQFAEADQRFGDQSLARPATLHPPLHQLIYDLMGIETFSVEWHERRDRVERLLRALAEDYRKQVEAVAASPASFGVVAGNIAPAVISPEWFRDHYMPFIEEACDTLHAAGKLAAAHLDANNKSLAPLVATTSLDFVESFTPPPDCDMTISEARHAWPDKALVVNFPSSVHLGGKDRIQETVATLFREAAPGDRLAVGVLEDIPTYDHVLTLIDAIRDGGETGNPAASISAQASTLPGQRKW